VKLRTSRERRKGRIEIIPMIDVMFFLLVTFMLASLSMQNLHSLRVNLPKGHATPTQTKSTVTLTVTKENLIYLDKMPVTLDTLEGALRPMLKDADASVILAADSAAPHGLTVQAMLRARQAGVQRFQIAISHSD
jgi:biopolymer transport protein ExbD